MHSTAKFTLISILKRFIPKKNFPKKTKKTQILNVSRTTTIPAAFYGKFATSWSKENFTFGSVNILADVA